MKFVPGCNCCGGCRTFCIRITGAPGQFVPNLFDGATVSISGVVLDGSGAVSDGVDHVTVTSGGSGYDSPATVTFSGGGGSGATAGVILTGGTIASVAMVTGGTGYTTVPTVSTPGAGEVLVAHLTPTSVGSVTVTNPGTGYTSPPAVGFSGGGGTGAAATAVLTATGIASVAVTSGGSGYTTPPTVTIGDGFDATATATVTGGVVTAVTITDPGTSYTVAPPVSFSGGGGTGATGTAALVPTDVQSVTLTNPGTGYTAPVTVGLTGGGGTGATATAVLAGTSVASVSVTSGGSGQSDGSTVTFSGGGGTGASARLLVSGATVGSIPVTNPGSGYTAPPTVAVAGATGGSGFTGTAVLGHFVCWGVNASTVAGSYSVTVTPPTAAPGNRFTSRTTTVSVPACSGGTSTVIETISMVPFYATGYHATTLCEVPFADTLIASTTAGNVTLTNGAGNTWSGCGMFAGGDATNPGACTVGAAGNTPFKVSFLNPTSAAMHVQIASSVCCIPASGATAVPHFRTDATCASILQVGVDVSTFTITSCYPVVFSVTCPATVAPCSGSALTVAHPMAGTVTFTE